VTFGAVKQSRVNKPIAGHFAKAAVEAGKALREFRLESETELEVGSEISVATFEAGAMVDVTSRSKGKGFQGVIKRYNFRTQDATHGNSLSHRAPGSIGQCQTPGRVWKGKKMAGHMGAEQVTTQSLEVVRVDEENNVLLIKGAVPGAKGQAVMVRPAIKARAKAEG
jgi:large subunit ribosomal protein L3